MSEEKKIVPVEEATISVNSIKEKIKQLTENYNNLARRKQEIEKANQQIDMRLLELRGALLTLQQLLVKPVEKDKDVKKEEKK